MPRRPFTPPPTVARTMRFLSPSLLLLLFLRPDLGSSSQWWRPVGHPLSPYPSARTPATVWQEAGSRNFKRVRSKWSFSSAAVSSRGGAGDSVAENDARDDETVALEVEEEETRPNDENVAAEDDSVEDSAKFIAHGGEVEVKTPADDKGEAPKTDAPVLESLTQHQTKSAGSSSVPVDGAEESRKEADVKESSDKGIGSDVEQSGHGEPTKKGRFHLKKKKKKKEPKGSHEIYAKKLKNRNRMNMSRKVTHAAFGLFFAGLNHVVPRDTFVPCMTVLTTATLIMELLRYRKGFGWMNDALHFVLGSSLRKHEMEGKFTGSFYYFFGVTCTAYLFPKTAATMGMCQLALADPSASYFGRQTRHVYWSRIEGELGGFGRNKGWLGFLGGGLFCFPFNYRVLKVAKWGAKGVPGGEAALIGVSLLLGLAGAFADLAVPTPALTMPSKVCGIRVPPFHVDDNFVVPIVSGYACTKIFDAYGWAQELDLAKYILF